MKFYVFFSIQSVLHPKLKFQLGELGFKNVWIHSKFTKNHSKFTQNALKITQNALKKCLNSLKIHSKIINFTQNHSKFVQKQLKSFKIIQNVTHFEWFWVILSDFDCFWMIFKWIQTLFKWILSNFDWILSDFVLNTV